MFQIFIRMDMSGKKTITISGNNFGPHSTVAYLYQLISEKEFDSGLTDKLRLIYAGKQIDMTKSNLKLSDFGIQNNSTLHGILTLLGGSQPIPIEPKDRDDAKFDDEKIDKENLSKNEGKCKICFDTKKVVEIHKTNGDKHEVCAQCMYGRCRADVWNGKTCIKCPVSCDYEISMKVAFTIAGFNKNEWEQYELRFNMNTIFFKACPNIKCGMFIIKHTKYFRVKCPNCKAYDFCWSCLDKWKGNGFYECGNAGCSSVAELILQITESWDARNTNTISGIKGVPKIRVCPNTNCQSVCEHTKGCKHMTCGKGTKCGCKHQFCQICLKPWKGCKCGYCEVFKQASCPGLGTDCNVAGLQQFR